MIFMVNELRITIKFLSCALLGVDDVDHRRYPDEDFRRNWILNYLQAFNPDSNIDDKTVQNMVDQVEEVNLIFFVNFIVK